MIPGTNSTGDVAQHLGVTERFLIEKLRAGVYPGRKIGRHWRLTDADVETILDLCSNNFACVSEVARTTPTSLASGLTVTSRRRVAG